MLRHALLAALTVIAMPAIAQDNGGGAYGGMNSKPPVVPTDATGANGGETDGSSASQSTDGSSIRGGTARHRAKPAAAPAVAALTSLDSVTGGTPVVDPAGAAMGMVSGRVRTSAGQLVGLQVKLASGTVVTIPAAQLAIVGGKLVATTAAPH